MKFYKARVLVLLYLSKLFTKLLFVELPPVVSVTALIQKENKYLFLDLSYMNGYGWPGGLVQKGEDLEQAVRREVFEETGLTITSSRYKGSVPSTFHGVGTMTAVFVVETEGELSASKEGTLLWLPAKQVKGKMAYADAEETLRRYTDAG